MINAIVAIATLMGAVVVGIWIVFPRFRFSIEAPKFRVLELQDRFDCNTSTPLPPDTSSPHRSPFESSRGATPTHCDQR